MRRFSPAQMLGVVVVFAFALTTQAQLPALTLTPDASCYDPGDIITVTVESTGQIDVIVGGQFFLWYDASMLEFELVGDNATPGDAPFTEQVYECSPNVQPPPLGPTICIPLTGFIDYAVGMPLGGSGTSDDRTMAVFKFKALTTICGLNNLVRFRDNTLTPPFPPSRLTIEGGSAVYPALNDLGLITVDSAPPVITCPPLAKVECPMLPTPANTGFATALDNCDPSPDITYADLTVSIFGSPFGWASRNENTASGTTMVGPATPPAGIGSFRAQTGAGTGPGQGGKNYLFSNAFDGFPLALLTELKYWTYVASSADPNLAPAINLYVDLDGNGTRDTTLVFEPTYVVGGAIPAGWQQWNALGSANAWWYAAAFGSLTSPAGEYKPLSYYIGLYPAAKIVNWAGAPGFNIVSGQASGGAWANFDGNIDLIEVNGFNFDFEPIPFCSHTIFRTWTATDDCGNAASCLQVINVIDTTPPVFDQVCPLPTINVNADAGTCTASFATVNPQIPTASDACSTATVTYLRSDSLPLNAPYPGGVTTITWTATDVCGNQSTCTQTVNVSTFNEVVVTVELQPTISLPGDGLLTRCITFDYWNGPGLPDFSISADVTFTVSGGTAIGSTMILVPCATGPYTCMAARDPLHTLRRTDEAFHIAGTQYVGDFTGDPSSGGDWLIGGNLNDDEYIDILDFGVFVGEFGPPDYPDGNTPCISAAFPHADVNGDGFVTSLDFGFIASNFLKFREMDCFGGLRLAGDGGPVTRISTRELARRGMHSLIRADLNGDGWLDTLDVEVFMQGGGHGNAGGGGGRR